MPLHLLDGETGELHREVDIIDRLRQENAALSRQVEDLRAQAIQAGDDADRSLRSVRALRAQLQPLYRALQAIFGEIEVAAPESLAPHSPGPKSAVWESWKTKLGGKKAEVIDVLLEHGEMTIPQLRVSTHSGQGTTYGVVKELIRLGLLNKNGGRYSL
jgi:uncharacterized protein (UPF0335 family)